MGKFLTVIFAFSLVFLPQIGSLYIANIIYYLLLIVNGKILLKNKMCMAFYVFFVISFFLSIVNYLVFLHGEYELRFLVQFMFTIQYFVLFINVKLDNIYFEKYIKKFSVIYSLVIIVAFFFTVDLNSPLFFYIHDRMWGEQLFNGWPNSVGFPLIFALYLYFSSSLKFTSCLLQKGILILACLLTTSRTALLGCLLIVIYYFFINRGFSIIDFMKKNIVLLVAVAISIIVVGSLNIDYLDLFERLMYSDDRKEIFEVTFEALSNSPLLGFGGTTLDVVLSMYGIFAYLNYTHTHNFILEILLRYGLLGFALFMGMIITMYTNIKSKDKKFAFCVFWIMGLFQIFVRDFVFLFIVAYIAQSDFWVKRHQLEHNHGK